MASAASKVLVITAVLCVVPPTAGRDAENEHEDCFAVEGFSVAPCPPGKRVGHPEKGEASCVLCEKGETFLTERNRCEECLPCGECTHGFRVKTNCSLTANVTCELIPEEVPTTTPMTTVVGTHTTQGDTTQSTKSDREGDITVGLKPTQEQLKTGDEWKTTVVIVLGVMLVTAIVGSMYQRYRIRQLRRDWPAAPEQPTGTTITGTTSDTLASEEGSDYRLLEVRAGSTTEPNGNAYTIEQGSTSV